MKTNHKSIGRNSGISTVEIVVIITVLTLVVTLAFSVIKEYGESIDSGIFRSEKPNKTVSGVVKDVRYYGVGNDHFVEVEFSDGRVHPFRVGELQIIKKGVFNKFELSTSDIRFSDNSYYLTSVVFEEYKIPGDSDGVEVNSHYEPIIKKIDSK